MNIHTLITTFCIALLTCTALNAQEPEHKHNGDAKERTERGGQHRRNLSPEEKAKNTADRMKKEIGITEKQYKKVYKLFLAEEKTLAEQREERGPQGGFGGPGMGGPHGSFEGGRGGFGGPGMGGPQGGRGGFGGPQGGHGGPGMGEGPQGQRPEFGRPGPDAGLSDEYIEKREKKLKKILKEDKYQQWREKHPVEYAPLPEPFGPEADMI
ncbi:MAG: hypothetical protein ACI3ZN_05690 [Candidatus Cryptobacteroides sp.]